jgi:probable phosphoglycerate mutase
MDLIIIRHGLPLTVTGADGAADPALSDTGHQQASKVAHWLADEHVDSLYSSPMNRAKQTALPLAQQRQIEPIIRPGLAEYDQHSSSYVPLEELRRTNYDEWRARMKGGLMGEMDQDRFRSAVVATIEAIIDENPGGRVVIVCHGGVINAYASHILGVEKVLFFNPTYTSINRFAAARSGERTVLSLNEAAHLR